MCTDRPVQKKSFGFAKSLFEAPILEHRRDQHEAERRACDDRPVKPRGAVDERQHGIENFVQGAPTSDPRRFLLASNDHSKSIQGATLACHSNFMLVRLCGVLFDEHIARGEALSKRITPNVEINHI